MAKCDVCGKTPQFGRNVSHSKRHTPRLFRPNVHKKTVWVEGVAQRLYICTRCLRTQMKLAK